MPPLGGLGLRIGILGKVHPALYFFTGICADMLVYMEMRVRYTHLSCPFFSSYVRRIH
jgi:hypothetical protein